MALRNQGPLKSSCNAGELSSNLDKKLGLKQFYNGGRRFKNIEPVPQSGFRLAPGSAFVDTLVSPTLRMYCLKVEAGISYMLFFTHGQVDIYRCETRVKVETLAIAEITTALLPELDFYAEGNTVGVFCGDIWNGIKIFREAETTWTYGVWPYESRPRADLGRTDPPYTKDQDRWDIYIRFTETTPRLTVACRVDGEETEGIELVDNSGDRIKPEDADLDDRQRLATNLQTALRGLPSLNGDVDVNYLRGESLDNYWVFRVAFTNSLAGQEYDFNADIPNTSAASALVNHTQIGDTRYELLISETRGGYGGMHLFQERAIMFDAQARKNAINLSRIGEYFDLDNLKVGDNAPILTAIRSDSGERILHVTDDTYLQIFTNEAEYFITNRTIKQSEPLNIVEYSRTGSRKGMRPQKFDGRTWFISVDGASLYTVKYNAVNEKFEPVQEDLLASHLIDKVFRGWVQRKISGSTMPRLWVAREDGRLVYGIVVSEQEITAFVEWVAASSGQVCDIMPDGTDQMWIVTKRGSANWIEVMEEAGGNVFQASMTVATDMLGVASGLSRFNGMEVWARVDGYIVGPFTISGGTLDTGITGGHDAQIGLWQAPVFESMPYWKVLPNEEIIERPAQIKTVTLNLIDTESVAIGANGRDIRDVPLGQASDDLSIAQPPFTGTRPVYGLNGIEPGPTLVISQVRPGQLNVRDYTPGIKF